MPLSLLSSNRQEALNYLRDQHPSRLRAVTQGLEHIDSCIGIFEKREDTDHFSKACGIALVKGKNFSICSIGLIMDGYGQESGALLRLLVEHIEILNYLERFPQEGSTAVANQLPSAGARAKKIEGRFKFLRDYLNDHASHGSFSEHSIGHILNRDGSFARQPTFGATTFDANFRLIAVFILFLLRAAVACVRHIDESEFRHIAYKYDRLQARARNVFQITAGEEA